MKFPIQFKSLAALSLVALAAVGFFFALPHPSAAQTAPELNPQLPTLFVVGDSTARNNANGAQGWGDPFKTLFDTRKINVLNRAMAGRSTRTFLSEGRWDNVLREMKAGDFVLLQLGHNDGGLIDTGKARASLPGLGEESREITKADGSKELVHTFGWNLRKMIADSRAKGATPILLSLTVRNLWKNGHVERGSGNYAQQIAEIARSQNAPFVDVTGLIADRYQALGEVAVKPLFGPDYVHTSPQGAQLNAELVVAGLRAMPNSPFTPFLSDKGNAAAFVPLATTKIQTPLQPMTAPAKTKTPLPVPADPALQTLFLIGDSTVRNGQGDGATGQWGWGEPVVAFFDQNKINVVNRAVGGLSSRTYLTGGFWADTLAMIKPGDFVMMQFGHNDSSAINDDSRARGTIRGVGEDAQSIDNLLTKQHETVHSYGWYLRRFIADAKAKGATPIVCSPIPRKSWTNGKINRNADSYGGWAEQVAKSQGVAFVPLNTLIAQRYDLLGSEKVEPLFHGDSTHTSLEGAKLNAEAVVEGLKSLPNDPLAPFILTNAAIAPIADAATTAPLFHFDFGSAQAQTGRTSVSPDAIYNTTRGFGFEPGAGVTANKNGVSSDQPFYFSVALPEGNYTVSVTLGSPTLETTTTVKAEIRRLMLEQIHVAAGQSATRTFSVNIRTPQISTGGQVHLKDREKQTEAWSWDEKLTLEFNGTHPSVSSIQISKADTIPTVYLLGDSTVCDQPGEPYNSWGQMLPRFFKAGVALANNAQSGESLRSSLGAKRLDKVLSTMKTGDYLFIQFGHNDMKQKGEGIGAFTSYKTDLKHYVDEARKRGAIPVLVTPMNRRTFDANGVITNSLGDYPEAVRQLAHEENLALIDLNAMSKPFYEALGPSKSKLAFAPGDGTHHNNYGSYELARCVVEGIRANKLGLVSFLTDDATPFDPAHPDPLETFAVPASPSAPAKKPDGN